jgi:hypothetical protein
MKDYEEYADLLVIVKTFSSWKWPSFKIRICTGSLTPSFEIHFKNTPHLSMSQPDLSITERTHTYIKQVTSSWRWKQHGSLKYWYPTTRHKSRDSSVGIALGKGLDDRGSRVRFSAGAGNFSLHHRVQNGSGAHPASYPMGTRGSFPGGKAAGAWSWPLTST